MTHVLFLEQSLLKEEHNHSQRECPVAKQCCIQASRLELTPDLPLFSDQQP